MDGFTYVDGIVAAIIIISALLAYSRGIVRETLAIVGWIAAAIVAYAFAAPAGEFISTLPVVDQFIADTCELQIIAGFAAVFAIALAVFSIFSPLLSSLIRRSALDPIDQALGFLFGVARGILLVAVAFFLYNTILSSQEFDPIDSSRSAKIFNGLTGRIEEQDPQAALGWITTRYDALLMSCSN